MKEYKTKKSFYIEIELLKILENKLKNENLKMTTYITELIKNDIKQVII